MIEYTSESELLMRANSLAGMSIGDLARQFETALPREPTRAKGWVGELLETALGASAGNRSVPDFESLGIELKTLPLNAHHQPKESTFVCSAQLKPKAGLQWEQSPVFHKLSRVMWIPVEADKNIEFSLRRVGRPFVHSPSVELAAQLKIDWEEHMETIALGNIHDIDSRRGQYLQLRPKAFTARDKTKTFDASGNLVTSTPRGFYLRTAYTKLLLDEYQ